MNVKCVKCEEGICAIPTDYEVRHFIAKVETFMVEKGLEFAQYLQYGYPRVDLMKYSKLPVAVETLTTVLGELFLFKDDRHTLCPSLFYKIKDEVLAITGPLDSVENKTVVVKNYNPQYAIDNPGCVRMENWERAIYNLAPIIGIRVERVIEDVVKPVFNVVQVNKPALDLAFKVMEVVAQKEEISFKVSELEQKDFDPQFKVEKVVEDDRLVFKVNDVVEKDVKMSFTVTEDKVSSFEINKEIIPVSGDLVNVLNFIKITNGSNV